MAVTATIQLPNQPAVGGAEFLPLGGDGTTAPLGCYLVTIGVVGDAGGGNANLAINLDRRYTNLIAWANPQVAVATAAPIMQLGIRATGGVTGTGDPTIVGTMPHDHAVFANPTSSFLWYPPPIYYVQRGSVHFTTANIAATETYTLVAQIYCFHPEVTRITPLSWLQQNVPGVSAPVSV